MMEAAQPFTDQNLIELLMEPQSNQFMYLCFYEFANEDATTFTSDVILSLRVCLWDPKLKNLN